jgi:hypothetical protein
VGRRGGRRWLDCRVAGGATRSLKCQRPVTERMGRERQHGLARVNVELLAEGRDHGETKRLLARSEAAVRRAEWKAGVELAESERALRRAAAILRAEVQGLSRELAALRVRTLAAERTAQRAMDVAIARLCGAQARAKEEA